MSNKRETKATVLIKHHLKQLRLPTMASECDGLAEQAARDNHDHLAYLLKLTERELIERERKSAERRLKAARFPAHKTLDQFDFKAQPTVNKRERSVNYTSFASLSFLRMSSIVHLCCGFVLIQTSGKR